MNFKIIIHKAEEGGYWGEATSIPGCFSQGETVKELEENMREAIEAYLSVDIKELNLNPEDALVEIAV